MPENPFRRRGTVAVTIGELDFVEDGMLTVTFPFPSMLLTEAFEWERRSGLKQADFWKSVGQNELVGLQMLLWQALRRQDGDDPRTGNPWSMLKWEELPDVDLFRMTYDITGLEGEAEVPEADADLPTTSSEEGTTTG